MHHKIYLDFQKGTAGVFSKAVFIYNLEELNKGVHILKQNMFVRL